MERLYDDRPITEMYVGYGKYDLPKMSKKELEKELDKANREIDTIKSEIGDAETYPSFILKERLINAEDYKDKIMKQISLIKNEDKPKGVSENFLDDMISNLEYELSAGIITEEYHDRYRAKLLEKKSTYEKNKKEYEERLIAEAKELEEKKNKRIFTRFKKALSSYAEK